MSESIVLKVTSAFLVGGEIARVGELVEVSTAEAKNLLMRGKAVLATASDAPKVAPKVGVSIGPNKEADEGGAPAPAVEPAAAPEPEPEAAPAPAAARARRKRGE